LKKTAREDARPRQNFIVITGSLYLVGEALELLGLSPPAENERALNEWNVRSPRRNKRFHFQGKSRLYFTFAY
jgi:hypothetical protein